MFYQTSVVFICPNIKNIFLQLITENYNHKINTKDIANILGSEEGQRKNVKDCFNAEYRAIINKVDNDELLIYAKEICKYLYENNIKGVITSYKQIY